MQEQLAATETDQSFEELYLLRQLAMNEVKQQRELAEVHVCVIFVTWKYCMWPWVLKA